MIHCFIRKPQLHNPNRCITCVFNRNSVCDNPSAHHYRGWCSAAAPYCSNYGPKTYISPSAVLWSQEKLIFYSSVLGIQVNHQLSLF